MQARMKKYPLTAEQIVHFLQVEPVGNLATNGQDGYPYIAPVHFVYINNKIFIHGLSAGEKIDNIKKNAFVCFELYNMSRLLHDPKDPCGTNTEYKSVIIRGRAALVDNCDDKMLAFNAFVAKYAPQHIGKEYKDNLQKMTAVIEVCIHSCSGKFYSE